MTTHELTSERISNDGPPTIPLGLFPVGLNLPLPIEHTTPVEYAEVLGQTYLAFVKGEDRKNGGHYQNPCPHR